MRTVHLNLRRLDMGSKPVPTHKRATAGGIADRDGDILRRRKSYVPQRIRSINLSEIDALAQTLSVYPVGKREHVFNARVIRQEDMHRWLHIQSKGFNQWLTHGKLPLAAFCVNTGRVGFPPKAYLYDECVEIANALNRHYVEHMTFRNTDNGLINLIKSALTLVRAKHSPEVCQPL